MSLAKVDVMRLPIHLNGANDDEQRVAIRLQLGSLMRAMGIFDGEFVELKLLLNLFEHFFARIVKPDPNKPIRIRKMLADILNRDIRYSAAIRICRAVDDALNLGAHTVILSARGTAKDNYFVGGLTTPM